VTKDLDILVVADPYTRSSKAEAARRYGVRIMAEAAFWRAIGVQVE
jgi:NAD-dependent DNA ligase